jgi:hypothetical protein
LSAIHEFPLHPEEDAFGKMPLGIPNSLRLIDIDTHASYPLSSPRRNYHLEATHVLASHLPGLDNPAAFWLADFTHTYPLVLTTDRHVGLRKKGSVKSPRTALPRCSEVFVW